MKKMIQMFVNQGSYPELYSDIFLVNTRQRAERIRCLAALFCDFKNMCDISVKSGQFKSTDSNNVVAIEVEKSIRCRVGVSSDKDPTLFNELTLINESDQGELLKRFATGWLMLTKNGVVIRVGEPSERKVVTIQNDNRKPARKNLLKAFQ